MSVGLTIVATFLAVLCPAFVPYYLTAIIGTTVSLLGGGIIAGFGHKNNFWSGFAEFVNQEWAPSFAISMSLAMLSFGVSQVAQVISNAAPKCFKAGTLVACLDDSGEETLKPIEEITVGDKVLAYDDETGEQGYKEVVRLFRNETQEWYHVFVGGQEIVCTAEHPFYVVGKGFVPAAQLGENDFVLLSNNSVLTVEGVFVESLIALKEHITLKS